MTVCVLIFRVHIVYEALLTLTLLVRVREKNPTCSGANKQGTRKVIVKQRD